MASILFDRELIFKHLMNAFEYYFRFKSCMLYSSRSRLKNYCSEFSSYVIELRNGVTQNDATLRVAFRKFI